jgi:hypothetical protein
MTKEFSFRYDKLPVNQKEISHILGYGDAPLPEPFDSYLEMALNDVNDLSDIRGAYRIINDIRIDRNDSCLWAEQYKFEIGDAVCDELKGTEKIAFYVCTAGKTISDKSAGLLCSDDPVLGYFYDILGSIITEAVGELMQSFLKKEPEICEYRITNCYNPGYCQWPVADQHKLFSFFPENICGISLTDSSLMNPVKSASGIIGIGKNVKFRKHICTLCSSKNCIYSKIKK